MKYGVTVVYSKGRPGSWEEDTKTVYVIADNAQQARIKALEEVEKSIRVRNMWKADEK